jgi:hypothetical protein
VTPSRPLRYASSRWCGDFADLDRFLTSAKRPHRPETTVSAFLAPSYYSTESIKPAPALPVLDHWAILKLPPIRLRGRMAEKRLVSWMRQNLKHKFFNTTTLLSLPMLPGSIAALPKDRPNGIGMKQSTE